MKAIVLENGLLMDIPEELKRHLAQNTVLWEHHDMREAFWPENKSKTHTYFANLPQKQVFYCDTTFDGYQQLELFIEMFYVLKYKEFELNIMHGCLGDDFYNFYHEKESSITPKELMRKMNDAPDHDSFLKARVDVENFKLEMNKKFFEVLQAHTVKWISWHKDIVFKTMDDIEKHRYEK